MEEVIDDGLDPSRPRERRRKLLPWWIRFFCWVFMIFGVLAFFCLLLGFTSFKPALGFYGFESTEPFSAIGLAVIFVGILKGFAAYGLWFEKDYAVKIGKADAYIGILMCILAMTMPSLTGVEGGFTFRLELLLLIPFLIKLSRIFTA